MKVFKGIAGAPGIASGKLLYFEKNTSSEKEVGIDEAIEKSLQKVRTLKEKALADLGEDKAKIFAAYEMLLEDAMLTDPIREAIKGGMPAEKAVTDTTEMMAGVLQSKKSEYMRQRADDIRYIGGILKDALKGADNEFSFPEGDEKFILAAYELTPVDTMMFDHSRLAGLVTEKGGATSHTVILAKSIGIPAVVGVSGLEEVKTANTAYLDGYGGTLAADPEGEELKKYEKLLYDEEQLKEQLEKIKKTDAHTKDGERIAVAVNIGKPSDLKDAGEEKFDGVGLFRSEFLYSSADKKPSKEEQITAYKKAIDAVYPNPVTIRTLDAGGDKQIDYLGMKVEENPFLGNRGIRLCLNNPEIFSEQLEAILIAATGKSVKIMLPMITCTEEIKKTRALISQIEKRLDSEGTDYCKKVSLGIMIETPASAITAEAFAKQCDFFSIGTNDLVQYITAADRGNADVENVYNPCHPAVLKMLYNVISAGAKAGIEVSVCGDMAANPIFTELLLGMGLKKFSVPLPMVSRIKHKIGSADLNEAKALAEKVLETEDEKEIINILRKE